MKNLNLLLAFLFVLFLSACAKDKPEDLIVGEWKASSIVSKNCTDPTENQNIVFTDGCSKQTDSGFEFTICMKINFTSSGTYNTETKFTFLGQTETETETGTYTINGSKLKTCTDGGECDEGEFSVTDKTLILKTNDTDTGCDTEVKLVK